MTPREAASFVDMKTAAERALRFGGGLDVERLRSDDLSRSAILYQLAIFGEASTRISKEVQKMHPEIEWRKITATRNILVHGYDGIDDEVVVDIIALHLHPLIRAIEGIVAALPSRVPPTPPSAPEGPTHAPPAP